MVGPACSWLKKFGTTKYREKPGGKTCGGPRGAFNLEKKREEEGCIRPVETGSEGRWSLISSFIGGRSFRNQYRKPPSTVGS